MEDLRGFEKRSFFAPAFRIKLNGQDTGREVISDVLEVSFTDDLENIDSFEFALHDWDVARNCPRYSSPWDANGRKRHGEPVVSGRWRPIAGFPRLATMFPATYAAATWSVPSLRRRCRVTTPAR